MPTQGIGVCAAPGVKQQRLQVIRDKIEARAELLARPQRFASSRPLSRREMEIERALFQGTDRLGFLAALYHRGTQFYRFVSPTALRVCQQLLFFDDFVDVISELTQNVSCVTSRVSSHCVNIN